MAKKKTAAEDEIAELRRRVEQAEALAQQSKERVRDLANHMRQSGAGIDADWFAPPDPRLAHARLEMEAAALAAGDAIRAQIQAKESLRHAIEKRHHRITDEQARAQARLMADLELNEAQMLSPDRDHSKTVTPRFTAFARTALELWAKHYGAGGVTGLTRWIVLGWLRRQGEPPGWPKGVPFDPEDLT